jgi:hypothetical protein
MGTAVGAWAFKLNARTRRADQISKFNLSGRKNKSTNELKEAKRDFSLRGPTFRKSGRAEKASARFARKDGLQIGSRGCP